jgi:hypothetical protein
MADISKIQLPSGDTLSIKDDVARTLTLDAVYTEATLNLALTTTSASDGDNEEF